MTYDAIERSAEGRKPVELFTFYRGSQVYRYTSADRNITFGGNTFTAKPVSRSAIESTSEMARGTLKITAPRDLAVADLFRVSPPTTPITFTLQEYHDGDTEAIVLWTGRIVVVEFQGVSALISLEPVYTSLRRVGLRRMYQRQCPHVLYSATCGVNRESLKVEGLVDTIAGTVVTVSEAAALANGYFAGGFVEYTVDTGVVERRFISSHVGGDLTLMSPPSGMVVGVLAKLYPGCDHTIATCVSKFSNAPNYGGFPYFATKNPFGGSSVF